MIHVSEQRKKAISKQNWYYIPPENRINGNNYSNLPDILLENNHLNLKFVVRKNNDRIKKIIG